MEKIASFTINHNTLKPGLYVSRVDGDVVTYDLRMRRPNQPPFLTNAALHTIEHLFATFARNGKYRESVVYFGPMGCRTGCYLLLRDTVTKEEAIGLVRDTMNQIAAYEGEIPGAKAEECGNYLEHDLEGARNEARAYAQILKNWKTENLAYEE